MSLPWFFVLAFSLLPRLGNAKGCFVGATRIKLANGSSMQLGHLRVGDVVASWDDQGRRPATARVRAVPTYFRDHSELVEITLPSSTLHVTEDHPFWSHSRQMIVSCQPNSTSDRYGVEAGMMSVGEALEGVKQEAVAIRGIRRYDEEGMPPRRAASALPNSGAFPMAHEGDSEKLVEVMTLSLEPHHWFYAEGVRVHNKGGGGGGGCFAPWMPVTMHDGSEKQIGAVAPGDWVLSWDESSGRTVAAEVAGVDVWPGRKLLEVVVEGAPRGLAAHDGAAAPGGGQQGRAGVPVRQLKSQEGDAAQPSTLRLLLTQDHPVYSARTGGLVSRLPEETLRRYGFHAEPMEDVEILHHHLNYSLTARVGDWEGSIPSSVFTLRLHRHHWFFVHGVRVHNKGGASSGGGSDGGGGMWTTVTASTEGSTFFVETILANSGNRRRYGTFSGVEYQTFNHGGMTIRVPVEQDDGTCTLRPGGEVQEICNETMDSAFLDGADCDESCCHDCMACGDMGCVRRIPRCEDFLAEAWEKCEVEMPFPWWGILLIVLGVLLVLACLLWCCCAGRYMVWRAASRRMKLEGCNRRGLTELALSGTYKESGKIKATSYTLRFTPEGGVSGEGTDADGRFTLVGTLQDEGGAGPAIICWRESGAAAEVEFTGSMKFSGCEISIQGTYVSKLVVDGSLKLVRTDSTAPSGPGGASTVAKGNVVGVVNPPSGP